GIEAAKQEKNDAQMDAAIRLDVMLHAFLFTQSGIPVLYSGDEIGQLNDYSYHENIFKREDSRYLHRGDFSWKKATKRLKKGTIQKRLFDAITNLAALRAAHRVFENNADTWLIDTGNIHILGIGRYYRGEKLLAYFNFSDLDERVVVPETEEYSDLVTGIEKKEKEFVLTSHDFIWLIAKLSA
ncbi:MAG: amylosucrase, partial [Lachnospiraceae bacterium]|nr:amylosucrase [Lachnospiraceae bacterium]